MKRFLGIVGILGEIGRGRGYLAQVWKGKMVTVPILLVLLFVQSNALALPDLIVESVDAPSSASPGSTISVVVTFKNQGSDLTQGSYVVCRMIVSSDNAINLADTYYTEVNLDNVYLKAGYSCAKTFSYTLPSELQGTYYVGAYVDSHCYHTESNENNNANYDNTPLVIGTPAPTVPTLTYPANSATLNDSTPDLAWTASNANYFHVQVDNNSDFSSLERENTNVGAFNWTPSALPDGTYYWRVRAHGVDGSWSGWSSICNFTISTTPSPPSLISPSGNIAAGNDITFSWNTSVGAGRYRLKICTDSSMSNNISGSPFDNIPNGQTSLLVSASKFTAGQLYYWQVGAIAPNDVGGWGNYGPMSPWSINIVSTPPPPTLISPSGNVAAGSDITFSWNTSAGAGRYRLKICTDSSMSNNISGSPFDNIPNGQTSLLVSASKFTAGQLYYWQVGAIAPNDVGGWGNYGPTPPWSINIVSIPSPPSLISPSGNVAAGSDITFSWNTSAGAGRYRLKICTDSSMNNNILGSPFDNIPNGQTSLLVSASKFTAGQLYYWQVGAIAPNDVGGWGNYGPTPAWTFTIAQPSITLNLYFNKSNFTVGETKESTVSVTGSGYTVNTYLQVTWPNGTKKYAYYPSGFTSPDNPLSFSDTKRSLTGVIWDVKNTNWFFNRYTFPESTEEGIWKWEYWYEDVNNPGVKLASDTESYITNIKPTIKIESTPKNPLCLVKLSPSKDGKTAEIIIKNPYSTWYEIETNISPFIFLLGPQQEKLIKNVPLNSEETYFSAKNVIATGVLSPIYPAFLADFTARFLFGQIPPIAESDEIINSYKNIYSYTDIGNIINAVKEQHFLKAIKLIWEKMGMSAFTWVTGKIGDKLYYKGLINGPANIEINKYIYVTVDIEALGYTLKAIKGILGVASHSQKVVCLYQDTFLGPDHGRLSLKKSFSTGTGTIRGKITDKKGVLIKDAIVSISEGLSATTNKSGEYTITDAPAGRPIIISVLKSGYYAESISEIVVTNGEKRSIDIVINPFLLTKTFFLKCPVNILVKDSLDQRLEYVNGSLIDEMPEASLEEYGDAKMVYYLSNLDCNIEIIGTEKGTFTFDMAITKSEELVELISYQDVSTNVKSSAITKVGSTTISYTMLLDNDGDDIPDEVRVPDVQETLDTNPPNLTIISPADNQSFEISTITVTGSSSDSSGIVSITVNGETVIGTTSWSKTIALHSGSNVITVVATDDSPLHNQTVETIIIYCNITADTITDLDVATLTPTSITLNWTSPGDAGNTGTATSYDIRYATFTITEDNWDFATIAGTMIPKPTGSNETFSVTGLQPGNIYYFAIKARDDAGLWSGLSNIVSVTTILPSQVGNIIYVSITGNNNNSGTSSILAKRTIQAGVNACPVGGTVSVSAGTYVENINFLGKAITVVSVSGTTTTIIDGNTSGSVITFESNEGNNSILRGFTIKNGKSDYGGGIFCYDSSPTITNCTISGNSANNYGGGIYGEFSSLTITNCTISGNSANTGGGICCYDSSPTITNCTISGNSANRYGGGISCRSSSSPTITNCTVSGNSAYYGGGISCEFSSLTITNCIISSNSANDYSGGGGGIFCDSSSSSTITNCTISSNSANDGNGGGISCNSSSPTITNCTISSNSANNSGGGIFCNSSSPTITNCTISGNSVNSSNGSGGISCYSSSPTITNCTISANYGGGIFCNSSSPTIINCTISSNSAPYGGGIYCCNSSSPKITNCTIAGNSAPYGGGIYCRQSSSTIVNSILWGDTPNEISLIEGSSINITYSDIQGSWAGEGNINADPLFVGIGNDHLQSTSPCIDVGSNTAPAIPSTDKDGKPRIVNGIVDLGAYEYQGTQTPPSQYGSLSITSTPSSAKIYLDSTDMGKTTPATFTTIQGTYTLKLTLSGYQDWLKEIYVSAGSITSVTATLISIGSETLFSDDFNDNSIDSNKWTDVTGNRVAEENNIMKVETTVTDQPGALTSKWMEIDPNGILTVTRRVLIHYDTPYYYMGENEFFTGVFRIHLEGASDLFGVDYYNYKYQIDREGFFLVGNGQESVVHTGLWDTWFDEKLVYNLNTGIVEYYINEEKKGEINVGPLPAQAVYRINLYFKAYGWWTTHYQHFDDISVSQETTIAPSTLQITTPSLPNGQVGSPYSQTFYATGGTPSYTWSIPVGTLPTGLLLGSSTGIISGIPTTSGTFTFEAKVQDSVGSSASKELSIYILPVQFGTISVISTPTGANIYLDSVDTGSVTTRTFTNISAGTHTIKLTLSGYSNWYGTTTVIAGLTTYIYATLTQVSTFTTIIKVNPSVTYVNGTNTFAVNIEVANVLDLHGVNFDLVYDAGILCPVKQSNQWAVEGDFLSSNAAQQSTMFIPTLSTSTTTGTINVSTSIMGTDYGVDGTGTIATIKFKYSGIGSPETILNLNNVVLKNHLILDIPFTTNNGKVIQVLTGSLSITSVPSGANIFLDGTNTTRTTPSTITDILAGIHTLKLTKSGYLDWLSTTTVTSGETRYVSGTLTMLGDFNGDFYIDYNDMFAFAAVWHLRRGDSGWREEADFNRDGYIDYNDMFAFAAVWHTSGKSFRSVLPASEIASAVGYLGVDLNPDTTQIETERSASIGDTFDLNVVAGEVIDLHGVNFDLVYDATKLSPIKQTNKWAKEGDFLLSNTAGKETMFISTLSTSTTTGTINVSTSIFGTDYGVDGTGTIANIKFKVIGEGKVILSFNNVVYANRYGTQTNISDTRGGTVTTVGVLASISHNGTASLGIGRVLTVTMQGQPGGTATFTISGLATTTMTETSAGTYTGSYIIQAGDNIINGTVSGYLTIGATTYTKESTQTVTFDTTPPIIAKIIKPASNTYLFGTVTVKANVCDNETGIDKVELLVGTNSDYTWGTDTAPGEIGTRTRNLVTTKYADGSYNLFCVAIDQAGNYATSTLPYPITIDNTKPAIPTLVSVTNPAQNGRLNLSWQPGTDTNLSGYNVHYGTQSGTYTQAIDTGSTATTHTLGTLTNGLTYYMAISAYDKADNESDKSNELSGTPTGSLTKIRIEDTIGSKTGTVNITTDGTLTLYLRGYDTGNNLIGDVPGTWTILGGIGNCTFIYGTSTIFNPTTVGIGTISATDSVHTDTTGAITVIPGDISRFVISKPATTTTRIGFSLIITGYDVDGNTATTSSGIGTLTNITGTILPSTITLSLGSWTGQATITQSPASGVDTITVTYNSVKSMATITVFINAQQGGTITGNGVIIEIGTISANVIARITTSTDEPTLPTGIKFAGTVYNIDLIDEQGNQVGTEAGKMGTVIIRLFYNDKDQNGWVDDTNIKELDLVIYHLDSGSWTALKTEVNGTENFAWAYVTHFSTFTLAGTPTITSVIFAPDNNNVKVFPNPYKKNDPRFGGDTIWFGNVSENAVIKVYNIAGELVREIKVTQDPHLWNIANEKIASGVYIYAVTGGGGGKKVGKIGIVK